MRPPVTGRDRLVHVVPRLELGTIVYSLCEIPRLLPGYAHTLLHETPVAATDTYTLMVLQAQGFAVEQYDEVTADVLERVPANAAILYDAVRPDLGQTHPSIYYAYANPGPAPGCAKTLACSEYRRHTVPGCDAVLHPFVNTRGLRQLAGTPGSFSVAIVYDDTSDSYPYDLVNTIADGLPEQVTIMAMTAPDLQCLHRRRNMVLYPHMQGRAQGMLVHADVCVCADAKAMFGYGAVEAMALGKSVICPDAGFYAEAFKYGYDALLYGSPGHALDLVKWVVTNPDSAAKVAANGKLWAGYHDSGISIGMLKDTLRELGA